MTDPLMSQSRRGILNQLRRHEAMTIDALVEATGLSKTATRAHLLRMQRDGAVERTVADRDGPGRPPATFGLTDAGAAMFPSDDDAVLSRLLRFLEENNAEELITDFFEGLWSERMRELQASLGVSDLDTTSLDARLRALEAALTEQHFLPVIERKSIKGSSELVTIRECNCPLPAAARASRIPCRLEIDFLSHALGARPRSISIASSRKETCTFEFVVTPSVESAGCS